MHGHIVQENGIASLSLQEPIYALPGLETTMNELKPIEETFSIAAKSDRIDKKHEEKAIK